MAGSQEWRDNFGSLMNEGVSSSSAGAGNAPGGFNRSPAERGRNHPVNIWREFLDIMGGDSPGPMDDLADSQKQDELSQPQDGLSYSMDEVYANTGNRTSINPGVSNVASKRYQR
jgi:hypothetical protein